MKASASPTITLLRAAVAGLCLILPAGAEREGDDAIVIGKRHALHSEILQEERKLHLYTPRGYEDGEDAYPVLYLLDGPHHFHHTTGLVQFLADSGRIPSMIVVGVANTDRTRDLTPSSDSMGGKEKGGGADQFLRFLSEELATWVEKEYRTKPYRILVGHSFGGLFGVKDDMEDNQTDARRPAVGLDVAARYGTGWKRTHRSGPRFPNPT